MQNDVGITVRNLANCQSLSSKKKEISLCVQARAVVVASVLSIFIFPFRVLHSEEYIDFRRLAFRNGTSSPRLAPERGDKTEKRIVRL